MELEAETVPVVIETHRNGASHAAKVDTGNGHHDEAPETQQSLFFWAEFMAEEPVERQNRRGKKEASSLSLFEWALSLEQHREEELIGAERSNTNTEAAVSAGRCRITHL